VIDMKRKLAILLFALAMLLLLCACKHEHTYSEWEIVVNATCTESGFITHSCTDCGAAENKTVAALGHKEEAIPSKAATCTEEGLTEGVLCSRCGVTLTEQKPIAKIDHTLAVIAAKAPTCTEDGNKEGSSCSVCGEVFSKPEVIPKLGHSLKTVKGKAATCTEDGISDGQQCTVCNTVVTEQKTINALGHKYTSKVVKEATCKEKGAKTFTCSNCGKSYTEAFSLTKYEASELYKKLEKSVGEILIYDANGKELGVGSCFVISADGKIVTNYHVIDNAYSAKIYLGDKTYNVTSVLAFDANKDLAVIKIDASGLDPLTTCTLTPETGATVYAIGSSRGLTSTFTKGIVTHATRVLGRVTFVQHDAAISNGNSGGPLVNEYAEVIGINTLFITDSQNLNLAVSIKELNSLTYGTPMTLAQMQQSKVAYARQEIINWLKVNGEVNDEYFDYYDEYQGYLFNLYYDTEIDSLVIFIVYEAADGAKAYHFINLDESPYEFDLTLEFNDDTSCRGTGYINPKTFTTSTTLTLSYFDSFDEVKADFAGLASSISMIGVAWFDLFLMEGLTGLSIADFGFTAFEY